MVGSHSDYKTNISSQLNWPTGTECAVESDISEFLYDLPNSLNHILVMPKMPNPDESIAVSMVRNMLFHDFANLVE